MAGPQIPVTKGSPIPSDGTRQLLQWGSSMVGAGLVAVLLLLTLFGGFTRQGATTNSGWFALIVALTCLPFGGLLLMLGVAKWLRNRARGREQGATAKPE
jgi:hypothetical protein